MSSKSSIIESLYDCPNFYTQAVKKKPPKVRKATPQKLTKNQQEELISRITFQTRQTALTQKYQAIFENSPSPFEDKKKIIKSQTQKN